jgi:hypothetical protein
MFVRSRSPFVADKDGSRSRIELRRADLRRDIHKLTFLIDLRNNRDNIQKSKKNNEKKREVIFK